MPAWEERTANHFCLRVQEVPQDLRSPARTPPSEEDSAEAERLKTEGKRGPSTPHRCLAPPGLWGCGTLTEAGWSLEPRELKEVP